METLMAYFGKFTAAEAGKLANFQFEYLTTLGFAAIVIFLGRFIVSKSKALQKYAIPAPVVSGLIFSLVISGIKGAGIMEFTFDAKIMKDLCQNLFFLCVGYGFSAKMLKNAGGKLCIMIAFAALSADYPSECARRGARACDRHESAARTSVLVGFDVRRCRHGFRFRPDL